MANADDEEHSKRSMPTHPCVGTVVWARIEPWPFWPALTVDRKWAESQLSQNVIDELPIASHRNCAVKFFNYQEYLDVVETVHIREFCKHISLLHKAGNHKLDVKRAVEEAIRWLVHSGKATKMQSILMKDQEFRRAIKTCGLRFRTQSAEETNIDLIKSSDKTDATEDSIGHENDSDYVPSFDKRSRRTIETAPTIRLPNASKKPALSPVNSSKVVDFGDNNESSSKSSSVSPKNNELKSGSKESEEKNVQKTTLSDILNVRTGPSESLLFDDGDPLPDADRAPLADYNHKSGVHATGNQNPASRLPVPVPRRFKNRVTELDKEKKKLTKIYTNKKRSATQNGPIMSEDAHQDVRSEQNLEMSRKRRKQELPKKLVSSTDYRKTKDGIGDKKLFSLKKLSDERIRRMREDALENEGLGKSCLKTQTNDRSKETIEDAFWRSTSRRLKPPIRLGGFRDEESCVMSEGKGEVNTIVVANRELKHKAKKLSAAIKLLTSDMKTLEVEKRKQKAKQLELEAKEDAIQSRLNILNRRVAEVLTQIVATELI